MTIAELAEGPHAASVKLKVIDVYARVSRASDKRDRSTDGQIVECKEAVLARGYLVGMVHVDSGKSAWNEKVFRPGWEALMKRLENGETDGVIIFELTRFTRRSKEGMRVLDAAKNGMLVFDSEREHDLSTGEGRKVFRDAISAAEADSDKISMRTRRGKRAKVRDNAEYNNGPRPFGFEVGNIVPREDEAEELRKAAKRLLKGESALAICADLNDRDVLTTFGNQWKPPSLRVALLRPCNVGDVTLNGEVLHKGHYRGIFDRSTYDQLVALYAGRRRGRPVVNLATGFVQCEDCRRTLNAKALYRSTITNPDGSPVKAYSCVRTLGGCGQMIDWWDLDSYIKEVALSRLSDPEVASAIEAKASAIDTELDKVEREIARLDALAAGLDERVSQMGLKRYDRAIKPINEDLVKFNARRDQLRASAPSRARVRKLESRAAWERRWAAADIDGRRDIVRQGFDGRILLVSPRPRTTPARERCELSV